MKTFLNHLLTDLLLILVVFLTVIILGRIIMAGENVFNFVKEDISEKISTDSIEEGVLRDFMNEEDAEGISEYINENEFDEEFGDLISSYFKYTSGIEDEKPDLSELEEVIREAIKRYEEETGKEIDETKINGAIDTMNKVFEETTPAKINEKIKFFLNLIYSDKILTLVIVLILAILGLIFIINKSIVAVVKSCSIVTTINTIFLFVLSYIINRINTESMISLNVLNYFVKLSRKTAAIFLIISIVLITLVIAINVINKKDKIKYQKKEITEEVITEEEKKEETEE